MLNHPLMAERRTEKALPPPTGEHLDPLLSDEPTMELVIRAREGDRMAVEALLQRCLPSLKRWAHGRLPAAARGPLDTGDLVQDDAAARLRRLPGGFTSREAAADNMDHFHGHQITRKRAREQLSARLHGPRQDAQD